LTEKDSQFFQGLRPIVDYLLEVLPPNAPRVRAPGVLKFALPLDDGKLAAKFGQALQFALFTAKDGAIVEQETIPTPPHEPGGIPEVLDDLGVTHVIAAGMGEKAQGLLQHKGIQVIPGNPQEAPEALVEQCLKHLDACPGVNPGGCSQCTTA
jgi:predicted Fe-Mo cluster-binding NifX family protein